MNNVIQFRKYYECPNCSTPMVRNDPDNDSNSYCSYGCGALMQPEHTKAGVFSSSSKKE